MLERTDIGSVTVLTEALSDFLADPGPLKEICSQLVERGRHQIILDLGNVACVTSSYLGGLISITRLVREHEGALRLLHLQPMVSSTMEMTRLSRIIEIFNDHETALKSFVD